MISILSEALKQFEIKNNEYISLSLPSISKHIVTKALEISEYIVFFNLNVQTYTSFGHRTLILDWEDNNRIYGAIELKESTYETFIWKPTVPRISLATEGYLCNLSFEEVHKFINIYNSYRKTL